jgi:DNA-binding ferritin-like protein
MLVFLRFLALVHQTHHWTAQGDQFYGDHKLFEELYSGIPEEIDGIAERAVGIGVGQNVDMTLQTTQLLKLVQGQSMQQTIPQPTMLAKQSLSAELMFLTAIDHMVEQMKEAGTFSRGTDDLVASIQDSHESNVYKLKQRTQSGAM